MEPRVPKRFVRVDVPHARDDALVEEHGLERRPPPGEPLAEKACREARAKRLGSETRCQVLLQLGGGRTCQVPKRRTSRYDTPVPSSRSMTARSCVAGASGKPPVMRRWTTSARPLSKRMTRYLPRRSTARTRSPVSSASTSAGSSGIVSRGSWTRTRENVRPTGAARAARGTSRLPGSSGIGGPGKNGG